MLLCIYFLSAKK